MTQRRQFQLLLPFGEDEGDAPVQTHFSQLVRVRNTASGQQMNCPTPTTGIPKFMPNQRSLPFHEEGNDQEHSPNIGAAVHQPNH